MARELDQGTSNLTSTEVRQAPSQGLRNLLRNRAAPQVPRPPGDGDVKGLWFALLEDAWTRLAVVPVHEGGSALELCWRLSRVGATHLGRPLEVVDATQVEVGDVARLTLQLEQTTAADERVLLALPPIVSNGAGLALARASDKVLLAIHLSAASLTEAERTMESLGRARIIGAVALHPKP